MPKHNFEKTTEANNKVFFKGEAEVSEEDAKALNRSRSAQQAETPAGEETETAESMAKANDRDALNKRAKAAGLDGNTYTNKLELSKAIIEAENK